MIPDPDLLSYCQEEGRCAYCLVPLEFNGEWSVWQCPDGHDNYSLRHLQRPRPNWTTDTRCACGAEFVSRCEFWKHQADAYEALVAP